MLELVGAAVGRTRRNEMKANCSLTQEEIDEVEKRFKHLRIKFIIFAVLKPALLIVAL